jgi:hypothetical protein
VLAEQPGAQLDQLGAALVDVEAAVSGRSHRPIIATLLTAG